MAKSIRNTLFTAVILSLTALGLSWNRQAIGRYQPPFTTSPAALAFTSVTETSQTFPLALEFSRPQLKLGQYQLLQVTTVANAQLEIVTIYPDGSQSNPQTLVGSADAQGRYRLRFQLDDFHLLGKFLTTVRAISNGQVAQTNAQFSLETWALDNPESLDDTNYYVYPLLP